MDLTQNVKADAESVQVTEKSDEKEAKNNATEPVIIGEVFNTYIIVQMGTKLLFVDKHAAHERMIFNKLKQNLFGYSSQLLMSPVKIDLSPREYNAVIDNEIIKKPARYIRLRRRQRTCSLLSRRPFVCRHQGFVYRDCRQFGLKSGHDKL